MFDESEEFFVCSWVLLQGGTVLHSMMLGVCLCVCARATSFGRYCLNQFKILLYISGEWFTCMTHTAYFLVISAYLDPTVIYIVIWSTSAYQCIHCLYSIGITVERFVSAKYAYYFIP